MYGIEDSKVSETFYNRDHFALEENQKECPDKSIEKSIRIVAPSVLFDDQSKLTLNYLNQENIKNEEINSNLKYKKYSCLSCNETLVGEDNLKQHIIDLHAVKRESNGLDQETENERKLACNKKKFHNVTNFALTTYILGRGLKAGKSYYRDCVLYCATCKVDLAHQDIVKRHIKTYHKSEAPFMFCKKCRMQVENAVDHIKTKDFACKLCNKTFYYEIGLKNHEKFYHLILKEDKKERLNRSLQKQEPKQTKVILFRCKRCNFYFENDLTCRNHLPCFKENTGAEKSKSCTDKVNESTRSGNARLQCLYCVKKFGEASALEIHLENSHPGLDPYGYCIKCNQVSKNCRSHVPSCDGSRECKVMSDKRDCLNFYFSLDIGHTDKDYCFRCMQCSRKFSSTKSVLIHHWLEHPKVSLKYSCSICFLIFDDPLQEVKSLHHIKSCSVEMSEKCRGCGEYFNSKSERIKHENDCTVDLGTTLLKE